MDLGLISVRYARALLKASNQEKQSEQVYADMQTLAAEYINVPELSVTIANPMLSKEQKETLLIAATGSTKCDLTRRFIQLVLKEGRSGIMQFIANSFVTQYRVQNNLIQAKLSTAAALSPETESKLRKLVESKTNGKVEFSANVDEDLIGGFVLEYDTYRLDASVKRQLSTILSNLKQ